MSESWMAYLRETDEGAATVSVDIGIEEADTQRWPHVVVIQVAVRERRDNGFPSERDLDEISTLEDRFTAAVGRDGRYVGRVTDGATYRLHVYTRRPQPHEAALRRLAGALPRRQVEVQTRADPEWRVYLEELFPGPLEMQAFRDDLVLQQLRAAGDALTRPRQVEHWLYLPDAARRAQVAARVQQEGFTVVDQHDPEAEDEAYGLRIAREDAVEPEHIHAVTAWLLQVADEQGGEYDGWECPVVT